jgi:hypothetical protein
MYKEGKASVRGRENWTIRNPKPDSPDSLCQASTSAAGSSSDKRSRTLQQQHSEGWECHHQDYHLVSYFSAGPPMPVPWGPPSMMFPPCSPWVGWYSPWVPPPMHFHPGWSQGLLHSRRPLRTQRPPAGPKGLRSEKPNNLKCQTRQSDFP